jgi:hypothetical protein
MAGLKVYNDPQERKPSTLEGTIESLVYQLDRYNTITNEYEKATDRLLPAPKQVVKANDNPPDPTGHLNTLSKLVERFSWLNTENENLVSVFNNHI